MRSATLAGLAGILLAFALPIACGGSTPPPKDETAAAGSGDEATSGSSAPADSAAPVASSEPEPAPAPAASSASSSGDIKPTGGDDPWLASHEMPAKDVIKTMRGAQGKVQACFKAGVKRDPSTSGEVKIRFVVTNDGAVRVWKDDGSSMSDGEVTSCVGKVLEKLKFPKQKSPGDAWGSYSIHFGQ